ncbi:MAG: hypothetical protein IJX14_06520 [Clostridia bacterium]|nr:hypothetical protein [Clostridia bacterium]
MEIIIAEQCKTLVKSCVMGLIFGAGYDIINILHVLCGIASYSGSEKQRSDVQGGRIAFLLFLFGDLAYMLTVTFFASVFLYHTNHGQFRLFLAAACIAGFCLYHYTVGRLVMRISEAIVRFVKRLVYLTVIRPLCWILRMLQKLLCRIGVRVFGTLRRLVRNRILRYRMMRIMRRFPAQVRLLP